MKNVLKYIIIVFIFIIILFICNLMRNYWIINKINKTASQYTNSNNYQVQMNAYNLQEKKWYKINMYYKNGIIVLQRTDSKLENETVYINGNERFVINESGISEYSEDELVSWITPKSILLSNKVIENLKFYANVNINSVMCNGKECYCIEDVKGQGILWIEKDTGLVIQELPQGNYIFYDYDYLFNQVTDKDIEKPSSNK